MTEYQRLFLAQARADFAQFQVFRGASELPHCHALHYLQMATELLGKASAWKDGPTKLTHRAFVKFLRVLAQNPKAQKRLGYDGKNAQWQHILKKSAPLAERIEDLAPSLAGDGPNPEYPWPSDAPEHTPVEFEFPLWTDLTVKTPGRQFLDFLATLFNEADAFL
jgi:hypothetical protein